MQKYECQAYGHIHDPRIGDEDNGVKPGTAFESLPEDWECPLCRASKGEFEPIE